MIDLAKVFVVDDDAAVRDSLRIMLKVAGYAVATFSSAEDFLVICNSETEGCIILDVDMPEMDGLQLQEALNKRGVRLPVIFLTGQGSIPLSVRAIKAGAMDFLTKPVDAAVLLARVKEAFEQRERLQEQANLPQSMSSKVANLTEREKEIMMLIIDGHTCKEIAERLGISIRTAEAHRAHVMHKTESSNLQELVRLAMAPPVK